MANSPPPLPLYRTGAWQAGEQRQLLEPTPPQTGTTLPFIWPPPLHLQSSPDFDEPVLPFPPAESILARETELDAIRCEDPAKYQGMKVYDSLLPPPHDKLQTASGADSEYNLQLAFDINTDKHTQWFYFQLSNLRKGRRYKLNMQNLMKSEAVYNLGMQPVLYSEARATKEGVGWHRAGSDACYFKNQLTRAKTKPFWTLTFKVMADYDGDTIYLAHCFPYRYTDLQQYLSDMEETPLGRSNAIRRRTLCKTLAGNDCDMLTITSPTGDHATKKGIVISGRVHPGETNASWMMKGVLDYLGSDTLQAAALREKFVFKIVPMLNPDGVIVGNYRCSLAGSDLNRQYEDPKRELFPEVLHLKQMIANFGMGTELMLFVDLHGHSKKSNIFMYGVENPTDEGLYMRERIIPTLLDRESALFSFAGCSFDVGKGKEGCGRVVMRKQLGIVNAYTMEASFMGADQGIFKGLHFNQSHFESMGHSLCEVLLDLVDSEQTKVDQILHALRERHPIDVSQIVARRDDDKGRDMDSGDTSDDSDFDTRTPVRPNPKPSDTSSSSSRPSSTRGGTGSGRATKKKSPRAPRSNPSSSSEGRDNVNDKNKMRNGEKGVACVRKEQTKNTAWPKLSTPPQPKQTTTAAVAASPTPPPAKPPTPRDCTKPSRNLTSARIDRADKGALPRAILGGIKERQSTIVPRGVSAHQPVAAHTANVRADIVNVDAGEAGAGCRGASVPTSGAKQSKRTPGITGSSSGTAGGKLANKGSDSSSAAGSKSKKVPKAVPKKVPKVPKLAASPARRPASSPASRSLRSPKRQTAIAAAAVERSPSAPPKTGVGLTLRRRGVAVAPCAMTGSRIAGSSNSAVRDGAEGKPGVPVAASKTAGNKRAVAGGDGGGDGSSSKASQRKGKEHKKKASDRPLPPLRPNSSAKL